MGLYDAKNKKGVLYNCISYQRKKRLKNSHKNTSILETSNDELDDQDKADVNNFFRTCQLPKDKAILKSKLIETKEYRREMIANSFDEYKEMWNFYFVCPELVSLICHRL